MSEKNSNDDEKIIVNMLIETDFEDNELSSGLKLLKKSLTYKLEIYDLHFKYTLNGLGFDEAKNDFIERII